MYVTSQIAKDVGPLKWTRSMSGGWMGERADGSRAEVEYHGYLDQWQGDVTHAGTSGTHASVYMREEEAKTWCDAELVKMDREHDANRGTKTFRAATRETRWFDVDVADIKAYDAIRFDRITPEFNADAPPAQAGGKFGAFVDGLADKVASLPNDHVVAKPAARGRAEKWEYRERSGTWERRNERGAVVAMATMVRAKGERSKAFVYPGGTPITGEFDNNDDACAFCDAELQKLGYEVVKPVLPRSAWKGGGAGMSRQDVKALQWSVSVTHKDQWVRWCASSGKAVAWVTMQTTANMGQRTPFKATVVSSTADPYELVLWSKETAMIWCDQKLESLGYQVDGSLANVVSDAEVAKRLADLGWNGPPKRKVGSWVRDPSSGDVTCSVLSGPVAAQAGARVGNLDNGSRRYFAYVNGIDGHGSDWEHVESMGAAIQWCEKKLFERGYDLVPYDGQPVFKVAATDKISADAAMVSEASGKLAAAAKVPLTCKVCKDPCDHRRYCAACIAYAKLKVDLDNWTLTFILKDAECSGHDYGQAKRKGCLSPMPADTMVAGRRIEGSMHGLYCLPCAERLGRPMSHAMEDARSSLIARQKKNMAERWGWFIFGTECAGIAELANRT